MYTIPSQLEITEFWNLMSLDISLNENNSETSWITTNLKIITIYGKNTEETL